MQTHHKIRQLAEPYVAARRSPALTAWKDLAEPSDAVEAYGVQLAVMEALARPVRGWKVALDPAFGPVAAPLDIWDDPQLKLRGVLRFELEVGVVLAADLPPPGSRAYSIEDIEAAIGEICCGVEVIRKRFGEGTDIPFLTGLADGLCHEGYLRGTGLGTRSMLRQSEFTCSLTIEGQQTGQHVTHPLGCPVRPVLEYANAQIAGCTPLRAGQVITTGSLCGLLEVARPGRVEVAIEGAGALVFFVDK